MTQNKRTGMIVDNEGCLEEVETWILVFGF